MAKTDNIKIVRLSTGEEIIGEVMADTKTDLTLKNPVRILVIPTADQKNPKVGFGPFTQWTEDKELTLNKNCVTTVATPVADFVNQYNSVFGGIVVPNSKLITP